MALPAAVSMVLPFLTLSDVAMLQLPRFHNDAYVLCSCTDDCPSVAEAKAFLLEGCLRDLPTSLCSAKMDAAFAGHSLEKAFDVAMCEVLQRVLNPLQSLHVLQNASSAAELGLDANLWRRGDRGDRKRHYGEEPDRNHSGGEARDETKGLSIGTVIITDGDSNNITVSKDHSADFSSGNNGNTVSEGSGNNVPVDSGNNYIGNANGNVVPVGSGSGNVVVVPIGSGNGIVVAGNIATSGNAVSIPVGSGNNVIVPVGSGNTIIIPVGNNNTISIGVTNVTNETNPNSNTKSTKTDPKRSK